MINETTSFVTGFVAEKTTTYLHFGFVDTINIWLLKIPIEPWMSVGIISVLIAYYIVSKSIIGRTTLIAIIGSSIFLILRYIIGLSLGV